MDYATFYARWLRFWYIKAGAPFFLISAMLSLMPKPRTPAERQFDGFRMLLSPEDLLQVNLLLDGTWEPAIARWIRRLAQDAQVFMDVGAHVGTFTLMARAAAPESARLYAFEPTPNTRAQLERNIRANGFDNITVIPAAAGAEAGSLTLYPLNPWEPGATSGFREHHGRGFTVPVIALDQFCAEQGIDRVDGMKIDTEGAEMAILDGMREGLAAGRYRAIILGLHPHLWPDPRAAGAQIRALADQGYALFHMDGSPLPPSDLLPNDEILVVHGERLADLGLTGTNR